MAQRRESSPAIFELSDNAKPDYGWQFREERDFDVEECKHERLLKDFGVEKQKMPEVV